MSAPQHLALIGCGAISESYYLPALATMPELRARTWLVEPSVARRKKLAETFGFASDQLVGDVDQLPASINAAINATPSHMHFATTMPLIERGISVLVEKPVAETLGEVKALVAAAAAGKCILSVNQFRRLWPSYALVHEIIRSGGIGRVTHIEWEEGRKFEWPLQTGFMFRRPWHGRPRGVVLDMGVHVLDTLAWWLGETPSVTHAALDGHGGPEAHATATLQAGDATIDLTLSFLVKLSNRYLIEGTEGAIRNATAEYNYIEMRQKDGPWREVPVKQRGDRLSVACQLIENFTAAAANGTPLLIDAASTIAPFTALEAIYERATEITPDCYMRWAS